VPTQPQEKNVCENNGLQKAGQSSFCRPPGFAQILGASSGG
jgi:hypothetical protein